MRGSRNRDGGIARNEGDGEPRSRSTSFDQHFRSHVASPGSTPSRGGRRRLEGRSVPRAGAEEPAVTSDGSTIFALSECKLLGSRTEIILIFVFVGEELEQHKNRTGRSVALQQQLAENSCCLLLLQCASSTRCVMGIDRGGMPVCVEGGHSMPLRLSIVLKAQFSLFFPAKVGR